MKQVFVDGSTRQTCVVINDGQGDVAIVLPVGKVGERVTNNQGEYLAIIEGLKRASRLGWKEVEILSDSQLAIKQINTFLGLPTDIEYQIKNKRLKELVFIVGDWRQKFEGVKFTWVPREQNPAGEILG